jgi:O-methyltransferase domain/Dimerisation domain
LSNKIVCLAFSDFGRAKLLLSCNGLCRLGQSLALPIRARTGIFGRAKLLLSCNGLCRLGRSLALPASCYTIQTDKELAMNEQPHAAELDSLITGYCISQAIYVAAELGIADRLAAGPRRADELASDIGAHDCSLYRLLRALASIGIFAEDGQGRFSLTPMAELLRSDVPGSRRTQIQMMIGQFYQAWGGLMDSIRTGHPAFEAQQGRSFFDHLADHHDQAQIFDDAMKARNDRKTMAMLDVYDMTGIHVLADIGGGNGSALVTILSRYPQMRGILFDRPGVVERARAGIEREGLSDRCEIVGGNFLEQAPGGADAYLLRHIMHNWDDEHALLILQRVHHAMGDGAKLLVIDRIIPPGNEPMFGKIMDLNMLVMLGGIERAEDEFRHLFGIAGFRLSRIVPTEAEVSVIEGEKVR